MQICKINNLQLLVDKRVPMLAAPPPKFHVTNTAAYSSILPAASHILVLYNFPEVNEALYLSAAFVSNKIIKAHIY